LPQHTPNFPKKTGQFSSRKPHGKKSYLKTLNLYRSLIRRCIVNRQNGVENSKYVVVLTPIYRSRDLAHAQCCMTFNTGRGTILTDNSVYVDCRET